MPSSKRVSLNIPEGLTLRALDDWMQETLRSGLPENARVRANVTWRGRVREIWASSDDVVPPVETPATYEMPPFVGIMRDDPGLSESAKDYRRNDDRKGIYIAPQQLTPGGPVHGGFTVFTDDPENQDKRNPEEPFS